MNFFLKIFRGAIKIIAGVLLICLLGLITLYGRLAIAPIDLSPIQPTLQHYLNQQRLGFDLELKKPMLRWQGWRSPIELAANDIEIHNLNDQLTTIVIPEVALSFRLRSLLRAEFIPSSLVLNHPTVIMKKFDVKSECDKTATSSPQDCVNFLMPLIDPGNNSRILKNIHFNQARFIIKDTDGQELWSLSDTNFTLERHSDYLLMSVNLNYDKQSHIDFQAEFTDNTRYWQGSLKLINLNPDVLCKEIKNVENSEFINGIIAKLPIINANLTGQINGKFVNLKEIISADIKIESGPGKFKENAASEKVYTIDQLLFQGQFAKQNFTIDAFKINSDDGQLQAKGTVLFDEHFNSCLVDSVFILDQFDMKNLAKYWPEELVSEVRTWLIRNVHPGLIPNATLSFKSKYTFEQPKLEVLDLKSTINLDNTTLCYMDDMPPVTNVHAIANVDLQKVDIAVQSGKILDGLNIKQAKVIINDLDKDSQHVSINDLILDGPIDQAVAVLNTKPLDLLRKYNISADNTKGFIHILLNMDFPLDRQTTIDQYKFNVDSRIDDLSTTTSFDGMAVALNNGNAKVQVNDTFMIIESDIKINDDPTHIYWKKFFKLSPNINSHLVLNSQLSPANLVKIVPSFTQFIRGHVGLKIEYAIKNDQSGTIKATADLSDTEFQIGGWNKHKKKSCHANTILELKDNKLSKLQLLQVDAGEDFNIRAAGTFDQTGKFPEQLTITQLKVGATKLKGEFHHVKNNFYKIYVEGDKIDLKPHMDFIMKPSKNTDKTTINLDLIMNIKEIALDENKKFFSNDIKLNWKNDKLNVLLYKGLLQKNGQQSLNINLSPNANGRRVVLRCADAGALFRSFQVFENIHEGALKLAANHDDTKGKNYPWDGKFVIENFKLGQVPFLGRLFSLAVPTGFGDLFSEGNKMSFDILKIKFKFNSDKLMITSGRAHGPSLGITVNGIIDNKLQNLNMYGSILPAYFINNLIAKIPLLGQIISGGKYEGLFGVSYKVTGNRNKPDISVNPLSVLTPGLFRQIFSSSDNKVDFDEDLDLEPDDSEPEITSSLSSTTDKSNQKN